MVQLGWKAPREQYPPVEMLDYARQFIDLGFTHLYFHCPGPDQTAFLNGYGKDVLPKLRGR